MTCTEAVVELFTEELVASLVPDICAILSANKTVYGVCCWMCWVDGNTIHGAILFCNVC